ncbi:J domain-containing protein [Flavobacterium caeni]|uniref:DnaJ domain-containing protein n=1 Tax=Flavobacterium caeni TaxID=490189 RepID=A0A1G5KGT8_9FLAO|nr:DnaJ domain-containing protein [Flavobacterium caeni]SCY99258.1 DnaJ domain-containing protein [Flavobacterium caeni]
MKNYYKILEIEYIASDAEIKQAYRKLALKYHPDKNQGNKSFEDKFKDVTEAYSILIDSFKRRDYDAKYKQYFQKQSNRQTNNKQESSNEINPSMFLSMFRNIKDKVLQNSLNINEQGLFSTLDEILSEKNIQYLINKKEFYINSQIIDEVLLCMLFLNSSQRIMISAKLLKLANNDQSLIQKISNHNKSSSNSQTKSQNSKTTATPYNTGNSNFGCYIFIIAIVLIAIFISNSNSKSSSTNYDSPSVANGDLNNTFVNDSNLSGPDSTTTIYPIISPEEKTEQERQALINEGWSETDLENGQLPNCYNFKPKKGSIDNKLVIHVGGGTDVAVKVMNIATEKCVRYVFINSGSTYEVRNVPKGVYYLKIAYGKDWYSKVENGQCVGKFLRNAMYEKGDNIMDFNIKYTDGGYSIPSFQLELDVVSTGGNTFNSQNISENEFNK